MVAIKFKTLRHFVFLIVSLFGFLLMNAPQESHARAFEMQGFFNYSIPSFSPKFSNFVKSGGGIGYSFFARVELGPGMAETGFLYAPVSMTFAQAGQEIKITGAYWTLPVLYRYAFWDPYMSIAAGFDYALEGGTQIENKGAPLASNVSYESHFGAVASLQVMQDIGENLSIVLDLRHRMGLGTALAEPSPSVTLSKLGITTIALGLTKHLED